MGTRETTIRLTVADNFSAQLRAFANQVDNAERQTKELAGSAKQAGGALGGMGSALSQLGLGISLAGITAGLLAAGKASLKLAMDMEQTKIAFTTMTGSAQLAQQHLDELREFAAKTPFQFTDLTEASKRMQAFGFSAESIVPMLTDIGDAVAALGGGSERIDRVTLALGQMSAKGKVSGQEMLQLTEAGIPAWRYLAEAIGVSTGEVMKMSEKGLIPADKAIQAILAGMRQDFGGMMAQQATTAAGKMSNLVDKLEAFGAAIGEKALPATNSFIDGLGSAVDAASTLIFWQDNINKALNEHAEEVSLSEISYADYKAEMIRAAEAAGLMVNAQGELIKITQTQVGPIEEVINSTYLLTEAEREAAQHLESWAGITDRANDGFRDTAASTTAFGAGLATAGDEAKELADAQEDLVDAQNDLIDAQDKWSNSTARDLARALDEQTLGTEKYLEALRAIDQQLGTNLAADEEQQNRIKELGQLYSEGAISLGEYQRRIQQLALQDMSDLAQNVHAAEDAVFNLSDEIRHMPGAQDVYIRTVYSEEGAPPRYASGGEYRAGRPMQVERDEILVPSTGGQVLNKQEAAAAVSGKNGGRQVNITNNISDRMDAAQFLAQLRQVLQFA